MINGWDSQYHLKPLIDCDCDFYKITFPTTTTTQKKVYYRENEILELIENNPYLNMQEIAKINELAIKNYFPHKEIEYINIRSVDKGKIIEIKEIPLDKAPSRAKRIVRDNDILISTVRPNLNHFAFIKSAKQNTT